MSIKAVVVGDPAVGKTSLVISLSCNTFPGLYLPLVTDVNDMDVTIGHQSFRLSLWDTATKEEYERLRVICYSHTNVFLLCFSFTSKESLENIQTKWYPEINFHSPETAFILVGLKSDLRTDPATLHFLKEQNLEPVSDAEVQEVVNNIKPVKYFECSALSRENLSILGEHAVSIGGGFYWSPFYQGTHKRKKERCFIS